MRHSKCGNCLEMFERSSGQRSRVGRLGWCDACNQLAAHIHEVHKFNGGRRRFSPPPEIEERVRLYAAHVAAGGKLEDLWAEQRRGAA